MAEFIIRYFNEQGERMELILKPGEFEVTYLENEGRAIIETDHITLELAFPLGGFEKFKWVVTPPNFLVEAYVNEMFLKANHN